MKSKIRFLIVLVTTLSFSFLFSYQAKAQQSYISLQVFYDQLSPYGQWVDYSNYGYIWIPDAGPDFAPYSTDGHWVFTNYGWTWASDYEWGWAPFHYGRWNYDNYYGWYWIPGTEWAPAWVSWRMADGYYGWEPLGAGVSLNISFGMQYSSRDDHWIFVRDRDFDRSDINHYYVNRAENDRIGRNSRVLNNTYFDNRRNTTWVIGPNRDDLQRATGQRIKSYSVKEYNRPGQELNNGQFRIYRPEVTRNNDRGNNPAPSRIVNMKDVRQPADRRDVNQSRNMNRPGNTRVENQPARVSPGNNVVAPSKTQTGTPVRNNGNVQQNNRNERQRRVNTPPPVNNQNVQQQNRVMKQRNEAAPVKAKKANTRERRTKVSKTKTEKPPTIKESEQGNQK